MFNLSPVEIGVIVIVLVLLFGSKRLPELGAGIGKAISNFKKSFRDGEGESSSSSGAEKRPESKPEDKA